MRRYASVFGQKMTEVFGGRDDHLVYRSVTYDPVETAKVGHCTFTPG